MVDIEALQQHPSTNRQKVRTVSQHHRSIVFIPNNESRTFFSMSVKFRSNGQDLYESKLNSLEVILFPIDNDNNNNIIFFNSYIIH